MARAAAAGATAIKIYFRLSMASALAVIAACRERAMPSTAHLEILDARALLEAGLTGVEHITSFGTSIASPMAAERYRQAVLADNGRGLGVLRVGEAADVVVVDGDPATTIADVRRVRAVFAAGRPVDLVRLGTA